MIRLEPKPYRPDETAVVFCDKCRSHDRCQMERIFLSEGIARPFCCRGMLRDETIPVLARCKCGGAVKISYACGEFFISCENDCMDIPACFHSSSGLTAKEWNTKMGTRNGGDP